MGWLTKQLLLLCIPLASSLCLVGSAETSIAIAPATLLLHQEYQPSVQNIRLAASPLDQPVASPPRSHDAPLQRAHRTPSQLAHPTIAPFPTFNSQQFDQQLQRYLRFVAQSGPPDILIVGSSRALQGIDPIVLQQTLAHRGYPKLKIFNFGVNGATAQLVDLVVRKLLAPDQLPRLLLWADGVRAFNSGRADTTYNRAIASPGYQLLAAGIRPVLMPPLFQREPLCTAVPLQPSTRGALSPLNFFDLVSSFTPASQQRPWCWELLKALSQPEAPVKPEQRMVNVQETTGFQPLSNQFKPDEYFQRYPKVRGAYDGDYRDFTLNGKQTQAFNNVVMFAKARQIPIVFVNLPLTQIYLDETRLANEQQFRTYLQQFARSQSLTVHDFSQRWLYQNAYFTDPSHLNRHGAAAVATQLGKRLIPPSAQP